MLGGACKVAQGEHRRHALVVPFSSLLPPVNARWLTARLRVPPGAVRGRQSSQERLGLRPRLENHDRTSTKYGSLLFTGLASPILQAVDLVAGAHDNVGSGIGRDKVSDVPTILSQPAEVRLGAA
ncbi:hypothetical protein TgHK011_008567 [Trichoderma gracile]|nr:hypothetical protein TgHK011_008567 [Trichoderma gracile]